MKREPALENQPVAEPRQEPGAEQAQGNAEREQSESGQIEPALKAIEAAIRDLVAEEDAEGSDRQEQREIADLEAQQDMARWAKYMMWATWASVGLTFAALVLIYRTLIHTRRAADAAIGTFDEAKKSTSAAIQTAQAALDGIALQREIWVAENRPWLRFGKIDIRSDLNWHSGKCRLDIDLVINNGGLLPAHDVEFAALITSDVERMIRALRDNRVRVSATSVMKTRVFRDEPVTIQASFAISRSDCIIDSNKVRPEAPALRAPILFCWMDYRFAFGKDRAMFALEIRKTSDDGKGLLISPDEGDVPKEQVRVIMLPINGIVFG